MIVLGLETSCDETAVAVVGDDRRARAQSLLSQLDDHRPYGGVVPEIAARAHLDHLDRMIADTMARAGLGYADLDAVAATAGPGLIGGLLVGLTTGKAIALAARKPFVAINHLEAHALSARIAADVPFPYLVLLVSGGHCQILLVRGPGRYTRLGTTLDDAVGEAFDKAAKMLGLGYPGGPAIERAAKNGDGARYPLPRPMLGRPGCDFSFSGLKTALRHAIMEISAAPLASGELPARATADLAASLQRAIADVLADRVNHAIAETRRIVPECRHLVVAGGVAANGEIRAALATTAAEKNFQFVAPPPALCTDNAVMVAWAGIERLNAGLVGDDEFAVPARPRWPLDPLAPARAGTAR